MPAPANNSGSCELRHWTVFAPGYWKGALYSAADLQRMAQNYVYLKPHLTPIAKLGHSVEQELQKRLQESLGFSNLGQIADAGLNPDNSFWIILKGIPVEVGGQINAGRINSGSVDLEREAPDPTDPSKKIQGPIIIAISLLGEEQPALKDVRLKMPKAVFADGSEVPAATSSAKWLDAMAEVAQTFSARHSGNRERHSQSTANGRTFNTHCFSDYSPEAPKVNPDDLIAALKGMAPDQLKQVLTQAGLQMSDPPAAPGAPVPPAAMSDDDPFATYAADPAVPNWGKAMMSAFSKFSTDCMKRFGAAEAAINDVKPKAEMSAAFSTEYKATREKDRKDRVTRDVEQAILDGKLPFKDKQTFIDSGLLKENAVQFSDGSNKGKTAYEVWRDELFAREPNVMFSETVVDPAGTDPTQSRFLQEASRYLPGLREPAYIPLSQQKAK